MAIQDFKMQSEIVIPAAGGFLGGAITFFKIKVGILAMLLNVNADAAITLAVYSAIGTVTGIFINECYRVAKTWIKNRFFKN